MSSLKTCDTCRRESAVPNVPAETIALITGANKGIGFEVATQLAQRGVFVLVGARDEPRGSDPSRASPVRGHHTAPQAHALPDDPTDCHAGRASAAPYA